MVVGSALSVYPYTMEAVMPTEMFGLHLLERYYLLKENQAIQKTFMQYQSREPVELLDMYHLTHSYCINFPEKIYKQMCGRSEMF